TKDSQSKGYDDSLDPYSQVADGQNHHHYLSITNQNSNELANQVELNILKKYLSRDRKLHQAIANINARKWILYQNHTLQHVKCVLEILGIADLFEGFVCIKDSNAMYRDNSSHLSIKHSLQQAQRTAGVISPDLCYYVDDNINNIRVASELGWNVVLISETNEGPRHHHRRHHHHCDDVAAHEFGDGHPRRTLATSTCQSLGDCTTIKSPKKLQQVLPGLYS
ncbi:suppressor of deletion of TFIIS, partial [Spiromyces aspiralis]